MKTLQTIQLKKHYRDFSLGPIDLGLEADRAVGFVGANGAGKTTLMRCLVGVQQADAGDILVDGETVVAARPLWRRSLGYVGEVNPFFDQWSGARNLQALSRFYPGWDAAWMETLARRLALDLNRCVKNYSTGQRSKLALVAALAHRPRLILLDEPATGLDPVSRDELNSILFEIMERDGPGLLYATHHVSEIEGLADRLLLIDQGRIVGDEIKEDLLEKWRRLSFRSEQTIADVPHAWPQAVEPPWQELISEDAEATLAFLSARGVQNVQSSRLSTEQITIQMLRALRGDRDHV